MSVTVARRSEGGVGSLLSLRRDRSSRASSEETTPIGRQDKAPSRSDDARKEDRATLETSTVKRTATPMPSTVSGLISLRRAAAEATQQPPTVEPADIIEHPVPVRRQTSSHGQDATAVADARSCFASKSRRESSNFAPAEHLTFILTELAWAREVSLDTETTALTPYDSDCVVMKDSKIGGAIKVQEYAQRHETSTGVTAGVPDWYKKARCRVLSFRTDTGLRAVVDLDSPSWKLPDQNGVTPRATLIGALHGKTWVGHNLLFDLIWLRSIVPSVRPGRIVDTMLIGTACRADLIKELHRVAAPAMLPGEDERHPHQKGILDYLGKREKSQKSDEDDEGPFSLYILTLYYLNEALDKPYQKPVNWLPKVLSDAHYDYCVGDIDSPPVIARKMLGLGDNADVSEVLDALDKVPGGDAYRTFEDSLHGLAKMHHKGFRFSADAADQYRQELIQERDRAFDELLAIDPALESCRTAIYDIKMTAEVKRKVADALTRVTGEEPPVSKKDGGPLLSINLLQQHYDRDVPLINALKKTQEAAKRIKMLKEYKICAARDNGRIHSIVGIGTNTGRTSSREPNLQNIPRDPAFRACFAATEGKKILAIDYSSIEMTIAAGLGERCYRVVRDVVRRIADEIGAGATRIQEDDFSWLGEHSWLSWMLKSSPVIEDYVVLLGERDPDAPIDVPDVVRPEPPSGEGQVTFSEESLKAWADYYSAQLVGWIEKVRRNGGFRENPDEDRLALSYAIRNKLDPHLVTALETLRRAGEVDLGGVSPLAYLEARTKEQRKELKGKYKAPRQKGKAMNFGLLYGMQGPKLYVYGKVNYGLSWTEGEAIEARDAWFDLYPEIGLWHFWTQRGGKLKADVVNVGQGEVRTRDEGGKFYKATTLSDRPIVHNQLPAALNYGDQGTGAEIALNALRMMFERAAPTARNDRELSLALTPQEPIDLGNTLGDYLVMFVHDEFVFEIDEEIADDFTDDVDKLMTEAAIPYLAEFGLRAEAEAEIGPHWIH